MTGQFRQRLSGVSPASHIVLTGIALEWLYWAWTWMDARHARSGHVEGNFKAQTGSGSETIKGVYRGAMDPESLNVDWQAQSIDFGFILVSLALVLLLGAGIARQVRSERAMPVTATRPLSRF